MHNNRVQIAAIWIFGYLCTNDDMESKVCEFFCDKTDMRQIFEI